MATHQEMIAIDIVIEIAANYLFYLFTHYAYLHQMWRDDRHWQWTIILGLSNNRDMIGDDE